jgi:hypothetical protein
MPEMLQTPAWTPAAETPRQSARHQSRQEVQRLLEQASYFVIFTVPDPQSQSTPIALIPFLPALTTYQIDITEAPRRFQATVAPPTAECGFRTSKQIGRRQIATQHLTMSVTPNNYQSGPGRTPPPTILLPFLSQRFWMYNGQFEFLDGPGGSPYSGFKAIAGGRFFPAGQLAVWIGGCVDIVEGLGQLQGFTGNLAIDGFTLPPASFMNSFLFRFVDPEGKLQAADLPPVRDPEPSTVDYSDSALIPLLADLDLGSTVDVEPLPDSSRKRIHLVERLRLADTNFDVAPGVLKTKVVAGEVVGSRRTTLIFDPDDPNDTIPAFSEGSEFTFWAGGGQPIGTLDADLFEARAFRTPLPGFARPYFRLVGFGPYTSGTGQFIDPEGMLVVNGALSLDPPAWSAMYLLRFRDPLNRFQSPGGLRSRG